MFLKIKKLLLSDSNFSVNKTTNKKLKYVLNNLNSILIQTITLFFLLFSGFEFFETSAKDNINVKQVFERYVMFLVTKFFFNLNISNK